MLKPSQAPAKARRPLGVYNLLSKASNHFHTAGREHALGGLLTLTHLVCAEGWEDEVKAGGGGGGGFVVSRASLVRLTP